MGLKRKRFRCGWRTLWVLAVCMVEIGRVRVKAGNAPIEQKISACGRPAVDGNLNQGFFDLIDRYTAGNRGIRVNAQLLKAAEPREDSKRQDTPCLLVKPGATPRITPSQFRNGSLKRHHEVIRTRKV